MELGNGKPKRQTEALKKKPALIVAWEGHVIPSFHVTASGQQRRTALSLALGEQRLEEGAAQLCSDHQGSSARPGPKTSKRARLPGAKSGLEEQWHYLLGLKPHHNPRQPHNG